MVMRINSLQYLYQTIPCLLLRIMSVCVCIAGNNLRIRLAEGPGGLSPTPRSPSVKLDEYGKKEKRMRNRVGRGKKGRINMNIQAVPGVSL